MTEKIKSLQMIHLALCAGVTIAFLLTGTFSLAPLHIKTLDTSTLLLLAIPVVAVILSNLMFRQQLKKADPKAQPEDNMAVYMSASLVRWAILEGAAFLILFNKPDFMIVGFLLIAYLVYLRPTEMRMRDDLQRA